MKHGHVDKLKPKTKLCQRLGNDKIDAAQEAWEVSVVTAKTTVTSVLMTYFTFHFACLQAPSLAKLSAWFMCPQVFAKPLSEKGPFVMSFCTKAHPENFLSSVAL